MLDAHVTARLARHSSRRWSLFDGNKVACTCRASDALVLGVMLSMHH